MLHERQQTRSISWVVDVVVIPLGMVGLSFTHWRFGSGWTGLIDAICTGMVVGALGDLVRLGVKRKKNKQEST